MLLLRGDNRDRHSFPTRRSSDLRCPQDLSIGGRRQSYDNACRHFAQNNTEMESPERKRTIRKQSRLVNVIFSRFFSCPNLIKKAHRATDVVLVYERSTRLAIVSYSIVVGSYAAR